MVLVPTHSPPVGFPSPSSPGGPHSSSGKPPTRRPVPPPSWSTPQTSTEDGSIVSSPPEASASPSAKAGLLWGAQIAPETPVAGGSCPRHAEGRPGASRVRLPRHPRRPRPLPTSATSVPRRGGPSRFCSGPRARRREGGVHPRRRGRSRPPVSPCRGASSGDCDAPQDGHRPDERHLPNHRRKSNRADGHFANLRDVEDYPERFTATQAANAASAGVVLDYHLGKRLPDFILSRLKTSPALAPEPEPAPRVARTDALIARQDQDASTGTVSAATLAATARAKKAARERVGDCASLPGYLPWQRG